jgi:hypothetical protein
MLRDFAVDDIDLPEGSIVIDVVVTFYDFRSTTSGII